MTMQEFYGKYNLNRSYFADIAGVGARTLSKFAEGKPIREESRLRIEKAMRVAEKYNLVRPECTDRNYYSIWYKRWNEDVKKWEKDFKELLNKEDET